jgi:tyrosyl-tRNA synthetase
MEEVTKLSSLEGASLREAKEVLAYEVTRLNHGEGEAEKARNAARALFSDGGDDSSIPKMEIGRERFRAGMPAFELFSDSGLAKSKSEARRLIKQGGAYLNGERIESFELLITSDHLDDKGTMLLRAGKKKYLRIIAID